MAGRLWTVGLIAAESLGYALAVAAAAVGGAVPIAVATGGGLGRAKRLLFIAGFLLMAYATVRLWPSSPAEAGGSADGTAGGPAAGPTRAGGETRVEALVRALPPLRWLPDPPPERRVRPAGKLFLASLLVLLASYLLEAALGVR